MPGPNHLPPYTIARDRNPSGQQIATIGKWERLIARSAPGKSSVVRYIFTASPIDSSPVPNLQLNGGADNDLDACQICLMLSRPELVTAVGVPASFPTQDIANTQNSDNVPAGTRWGAPFADVEWGIGGIKNKARVDILNGLGVNLNASWLSVSVGVECAFDTGGQYYRLASFASPGSSKFPSAQRTIDVSGPYSSGIAGPYKVPAFAKRFWLLSSPADLGTLEFWADPACAIASMGTITPIAGIYGPYPIPNQAYYFLYTRLAGAPRVKAVFDLAI